MTDALKITTRNITLDPATEALLTQEAAKLAQFYGRHLVCHALVEVPHRYATGEHIAYTVRLELTVPGGELAVTRQEDKDLMTVIQRVFDAGRRQLQDYAARQRETGRGRSAQPTARVSRLFPFEGYGFLETPDGTEIYFHHNAVAGDRFDRLAVGTAVRFVEDQGEKGPQASSVVPVRKARRAGTGRGSRR